MMQEIIKLLKEKGFVDGMQRALDATTAIMGDSEESHVAAAKYCLFEFLKKHTDVEDKFVEFASDFAAETIIKELDLKPNKDYEPTGLEKLVAMLSALELLKNENKEDK